MRGRCLVIGIVTLMGLIGPGYAAGSPGSHDKHARLLASMLTTITLPGVSLHQAFGGCGRGRARSPSTHKCLGPADTR